jgi:hypothetical protein
LYSFFLLIFSAYFSPFFIQTEVLYTIFEINQDLDTF